MFICIFSAAEHAFKGIFTSLPKPGGGEFGKFYSLPALNDPRIGNAFDLFWDIWAVYSSSANYCLPNIPEVPPLLRKNEKKTKNVIILLLRHLFDYFSLYISFQSALFPSCFSRTFLLSCHYYSYLCCFELFAVYIFILSILLDLYLYKHFTPFDPLK